MTGRGRIRPPSGNDGAVTARRDSVSTATRAAKDINAGAKAGKGARAGRNDPVRIAELKSKLGDDAYMAGAILRIATVLSARLTEGYLDGGRSTR